jgi:glycosyltransferase involved in cell wall biosynthesis
MTRVALLLPNLTRADAVCNDVFGMQRVLSDRGHDVRIFPFHASPGLDCPGVEPLGYLDAFLDSPVALLVYHFGVGWAEGRRIFEQARCRRVLKYHNITPPEYFAPYSPVFALPSCLGQLERSILSRAGADLYLADSAFNLNDLLDAGVDPARGRVVPPFHQIDRLQELAPVPELLAACADGWINLVMVGRVVPNKGYEDLIDAFAFYHHGYNPRSRLLLIGKGERQFSAYLRALREQIHQLCLDEVVHFTGPVSPAELRTVYEVADVFLLTSRHEGFCVPLVEAMALEVPIVAAGGCAVPETLGDGGLHWEEPDPELLAESIHRVVSDGAVSTSMRQLGRRRYENHFRNEQIETALMQALYGLL